MATEVCLPLPALDPRNDITAGITAWHDIMDARLLPAG